MSGQALVFAPSHLSSGHQLAKDNSPVALAAVALPIVGLLLVIPLGVAPWVIKQFKPEWSYGKRVATGFVVSFGIGAVKQIAKAASGKDDPVTVAMDS